MRKHASMIGLLLSVTCLLVANVGGAVGVEDVSSLTYQTSVGVSFTFNPRLAITLSSADLIISNLAPGSSADSNIITVTVSTNTAYGYTLNATVGEATNYNTRNLIRSGVADNFASIDYGTSLASLTTDNTWGYSYKPSGNSTSWTNYSGLPLYSDTNNVATLISTQDPADSDSVEFKIAAKASATQPAGEYRNVINFMAVSNPEPDYLYDRVAALSKGTLAANNVALTDTITTPTSTDKSTDTSNSGVYEYDPTIYGVASDAANTHKIYFYRGILETNPGTYGSAGSANTYPNYVKLDNNTCWRIVRTTGSGGVKMIYNGAWAGSTCANSQDNTQVTTQTFTVKGSSSQSSWYKNVAYVGYTYNDNVTDSTTSTSVDTVFGSDSNPSLNNTRSNIKTYIEDTWYANNMTSYTNKLEASAGYCADRTAYSNVQLNPTVLTTIVPYQESSALMYFGSNERVSVVGAKPTLACERGVVDLFHYVANSTGVSNELRYPVALLTADEAALSGSGWSNSTTVYSAQSFLRSGSDYWLLSPCARNLYGEVHVFDLHSSGYLNNYYTSGSRGVRPVISLKPYTEIAGGSGTATDPWTIK